MIKSSVEIWVALTLGLAAAAAAIRWWLNHPRPAILGQSDLSSSIHQMLRWTEDGGRIRLTALDRDAVVTLTRLAGDGRRAELEVDLANDRLDPNRVSELDAELKSLGVSLIGREVLRKDSHGRDVLRFATYLPTDVKECGLLADLALRAVGLTDGDRYRYRFEGSVNAERLRQDAAERTHVAGVTAPREWQASIFRRMSKSLRAASSFAKARGSAEERNDCDPPGRPTDPPA